MTDTEAITAQLKKRKKKHVIHAKDLLSSGYIPLNIAATGRPIGCYAKGCVYLMVGDSSSGKTWLCLSALAEAAINDHFSEYDLVYNNVENGVLMSIPDFFGQRLADRIKFIRTPTIEECYFDLDDRCKSGKPFIEIVDSQDALTSAYDDDKFQENKKLFRGGKAMKGSFGDGKAKVNSQMLRRINSKMEKTGSILILVCQTRDNIDALGFQEKKTRAGGKSLKFYAAIEFWTSIRTHIKKKVKEKDREQGIIAQIKIKKNRVMGRDRTVLMPIYHSFGIDDIGGCIDYLVEEGHWKVSSGSIRASELDFSGKKEKMVQFIEEEELETTLHNTVAEVWNEIEELSKIRRKARY